MKISGNERLLEKLAAEYVLGTLKGGARRRYESWLGADPVVRRATAEWQDRLHPMAQLATAETPPPHVWHGIAAKLGLRRSNQPVKRSFWQGLFDDLVFWRGLGMASTAMAAILLAVLAFEAPAPVTPMTSFVAMLTDDKSQPVAVVTGDEARRILTMKVVLPQTVAADRSLQLWAVPKSGTPRPLGLVAGNGSIELPLPIDAGPQSVSLLAISLEQKGGSPNPNGPTGPIVYKGAWLAL